jgi:hypothetical protein
MADSRQQIYSFIDQSITDPLNQQNTAEVVRGVLKYMVQHSANLADDGGLFNTPEGVTWTVKPTLQVSGNTLTVSEAEADWAGVTVLYAAATFTLATPAEALERMDTVYANENGTYGVDAGPEGESAVAEQPPVGTLLAGFVLVGAAGGEVQPVSSAVDYAPVSLTDAVTVTYNTYQQGKVRPNAELPLSATPLLQTLSIANTQIGYYYQIRIKNCTGQNVTISPVSGVTYYPVNGIDPLTTVTLPSEGDCILTYYHASSIERLIEVLDGNAGDPLEGEATADNSAAVISFTNPFGHIRTSALTGNQTFTKSGTVLGSTVVQPFTSTGSNTLTFDFTHYLLNSDFTSGGSLTAGEYELYFSNRGTSVAVSIASIGAAETPVPNSAPVASAGADQSITLPTNSVTLSGSGTDSDGTIASYSWSKVSGGAATITSPSAASTTVTGLAQGTYVFRLTVTDNEGATATDDITITVNPQGITQLSAPTGLTATASGQNQINLSWTDTNA